MNVQYTPVIQFSTCRFVVVLYDGAFNLSLLWNPCTEFTIRDSSASSNDCIDVEVSDINSLITNKLSL